MPLWQIYHPPGTYESASEKETFAKDITAHYTNVGLPPFYVVVHFNKIENENVYVGGTVKTASQKPFVRVVIAHIAVRLPDDDNVYLGVTTRLDKIFKSHVLDKGYDLEYHIDETERRLWKINGLIPPPFKSEEEKVWFRQNKPLPYEGAYPTKTSNAAP